MIIVIVIVNPDAALTREGSVGMPSARIKRVTSVSHSLSNCYIMAFLDQHVQTGSLFKPNVRPGTCQSMPSFQADCTLNLSAQRTSCPISLQLLCTPLTCSLVSRPLHLYQPAPDMPFRPLTQHVPFVGHRTTDCRPIGSIDARVSSLININRS
jgi:hypothetical protein